VPIQNFEFPVDLERGHYTIEFPLVDMAPTYPARIDPSLYKPVHSSNFE
jgi:hypothetical protein